MAKDEAAQGNVIGAIELDQMPEPDDLDGGPGQISALRRLEEERAGVRIVEPLARSVELLGLEDDAMSRCLVLVAACENMPSTGSAGVAGRIASRVTTAAITTAASKGDGGAREPSSVPPR